MKALSTSAYLQLYPTSSTLCKVVDDVSYPGCILLRSGMLQFTAETAYRWSPQFPGDYAAARLQDFTNAVTLKGNRKVLELRKEQEEIRLRKATYLQKPNPYVKKQSKRLFTTDHILYEATLEFPIELRIFGDDDTSYSKYYRNQSSAIAEFELFETCQPLDFNELIKGFNFAFTN